MPVKQWNFRKAKWSHYIALTNKFAKTLLPPDSLDVDAAYQDLCDIIKRAAKKTISHANIETTIFHVWMQNVNPFIKLSCSLLRKTTQVWLLQLCFPSLTGSGGIDGPRQFGALTFHTLVEKNGVFSTTLLVGLTTLFRHCPVSADTITSQLVRNGKYEAVDRKLSRLVSQEVSDFGGPQHQTQ